MLDHLIINPPQMRIDDVGMYVCVPGLKSFTIKTGSV